MALSETTRAALISAMVDLLAEREMSDRAIAGLRVLLDDEVPEKAPAPTPKKKAAPERQEAKPSGGKGLCHRLAGVMKPGELIGVGEMIARLDSGLGRQQVYNALTEAKRKGLVESYGGSGTYRLVSKAARA